LLIKLFVISDKLKRKKLHTLLQKYEKDLCHAQGEGNIQGATVLEDGSPNIFSLRGTTNTLGH
jgi:hypothetical protein